jgi:ECF transporter S component (folate family)
LITTKKLAISAILIAMAVVLTRVLAINTMLVKIGFGFIPIIVAALYFGPLYTGVISAIADIIGVFMFPVGAFNPFFTISYFVMGVVYGVFLYPASPVSKGLRSFGYWIAGKLRLSDTGSSAFAEIFLAFITGTFVSIVFSLALNTFLIHLFFRINYAVLIPSRIIQVVILIPLHTAMIPLITAKVIPQLKRITVK